MRFIYRWLRIIACICLVLLILPAGSQGAGEYRTVRVGFFPFEGYYEVLPNQERYGYGYELMQHIALHTNWTYDYVDDVKTWQELEQMLTDGRLDMLTCVQQTPDNIGRFSFSQAPIGTSSTLLTVRAGNAAFIAGDYGTYDGARVGMMRGNAHNNKFQSLSNEKGFSYTPVYFDSLAELLQALQAGTAIDAAVTSNLRPIHNEWILEQFSPSPYYLMVRKDDYALQDDMNHALHELDVYSPNWRTELFTKYYTPDNGGNLLLSAEERDYLQELKTAHKVFTVVFCPDNAPYAYFENGEAKGVVLELFAEIAQRAGIDYTVVEAKSCDDFQQLVRSGTIDLIVDPGLSHSQAEQLGYKLSLSFLHFPVAQVSRLDAHRGLSTIALPQSMLIHPDKSVAALQENKKFLKVHSTLQALQAVIDGQADGAYVYMYTAQKYMNDDMGSRLQISLLPAWEVEQSIGSAVTNDHCLLSILSKSAESVRGDYAQQMVLKYTALSQSKVSLRKYIYANPLLALAVFAIIFIAILLAVLSLFKIRQTKREHLHKLELEQFQGYICQANDFVIEICPAEQRVSRYIVHDGHVEIENETGPWERLLPPVHPDDAAGLQEKLTPEALQSLMDTHGEVYMECRCLDEAGTYRWYGFTLQAGHPGCS